MNTPLRSHLTGWFSDAQARVLCYVLGPVSSPLIFHFGHYGAVWSVRFHSFHSVLMTAVWVIAWGTLRLIEHISPWFLATLVRELRFAMNLGFVVVWAFLLATAYGGGRCAVVPLVHRLAVRLARRSEKHLKHVGAESS